LRTIIFFGKKSNPGPACNPCRRIGYSSAANFSQALITSQQTSPPFPKDFSKKKIHSWFVQRWGKSFSKVVYFIFARYKGFR
jgi:hypothetical protein